MTGKHVHEFQASLERCLESPAFIGDFYDRFKGTSDEIRRKFEHTDFARQNRALADSLRVTAMSAQGGHGNIARAEMKRLARRHQSMGIGAGMYDVWLDCVLHAARAHDPQFSPAVETAWRAILGSAIDAMRQEPSPGA